MATFDFKSVPPWGYAIGIGAGGLLYYYNKKKTAAPVTTPADNTSAVGVGTGSYTEYVPVDQTTSTQPVYSTNEQWATAAINWLIAQGYSPGLANSAITKGIAGGVDSSGNGMSASEYSLWSLALQQFGSPPQPVNVAPPTQAPGPAGGGKVVTSTIGNNYPPPPAKATVRYYTVKAWPAQGSSLWSIAQIYYHDGNKWSEIYNANRSGITRADGTPGIISNANFLYPGEKLIIP